MFPTTYFIKTFGCQMNESDSERIAGFLESKGLKSTENINSANLVVFNTCGVRQMAEDRVYGQIHNLKQHATRDKRQVCIVLTGCLANRKDVQKRLKDKVDLFCITKEFPEKIKSILDCHAELVSASHKILNQVQDDTCSYLSIKPKYTNSHIAFVPIMTGCNNFCSYCVVPYARGPEISRPSEEIIKEVRNLVKKGCKEIILLGQNVNSYYDKNNNFSHLLKKINDIPGHFWIWFISNHPKDFSSKLIETATKCEKVCECIHLPLQAGDDKILHRMNRKYTVKEYLKLIEKIKAAFAKNKPDKIYSITSDIIVGFPGETKKQFLESAKAMEKVAYDMVYFGQFSRRPGTAAWNMKDNVKKSEKVRRENYLNEILKKTAFANNKKYLGSVMEVLVDKEKKGTFFGHTRTYKNVKIKTAKNNLAGKIIKAKITKANIWNLEASY